MCDWRGLSYATSVWTARVVRGMASGMTIASLLEPVTGQPGPARLTHAADWMQGRTLYGGASALVAYTMATRAFSGLPPLRAGQIALPDGQLRARQQHRQRGWRLRLRLGVHGGGPGQIVPEQHQPGIIGEHCPAAARRDSGIRSLGDLRGHNVAFQRSSSTSAYYVPAAELLERGMRLEILLAPTDGVASHEVGYLFARSELNISTWVHKRLVDAGVMSNLDWDNPRHMPPSFARDFVIIGKSEPYPRALELVRGDLDARVRERLAQVLTDAAADPDASEALLKFFKTTRFLPLDPQTSESLRRLSTGIDRVRREVE